MTNDKRTIKAFTWLKSIRLSPVRNGYIQGDDDANRIIDYFEALYAEELTAERRRAEELAEQLEIAKDSIRDVCDEEIRQLETRLQEAENKCKFQATHYELSIKELEARLAESEAHNSMLVKNPELLMERISKLEAELSRHRAALEEIRDSVLHGRHQLAEGVLDNYQTNAVLSVIDDALASLEGDRLQGGNGEH